MHDSRAENQETTLPIIRAPRLLLADDDAVSRKLLGSALERSGFDVQIVGAGEAALELILTTRPDLLVLDFEMPGLNGAEVCHRLRASEREDLRALPVIMLTAHAGEAEEIDCLQAGANDFVTKPVSREILTARIQTQLRLRALSDELRWQNEELARWRSAQEADLAAARATQRALIPSAPPTLKAWQVQTMYQPLIQVGGDVFGWQAMGEGRWLFWLADATGHGAAAALFTTLAAQLFRQAAEAESAPAAILRSVNREFHSVFSGRSFMTACCALVEPGGHLTFCGAGHPPLLVRRARGTIESFGPHSTVLGVHEDMSPAVECSEMDLAAGDLALLYTDGVFAFQQSDGARFTHKAVERLLPSIDPGGDYTERLIARLRDDSNGGSCEDDIASLALFKM